MTCDLSCHIFCFVVFGLFFFFRSTGLQRQVELPPLELAHQHPGMLRRGLKGSSSSLLFPTDRSRQRRVIAFKCALTCDSAIQAKDP